MGHDCGVCSDCMEWPAHCSWWNQHPEAKHPALSAVIVWPAAVDCTSRMYVCIYLCVVETINI